ncbi:hypothetical protein R1flu_024299 [Riccia fluitans]|uniref:Uncharacterized protein n=1 Tax=Riccia fluitans TaxID=41844 RepID=A0ABD1XUH6_9MARC
MTSSQVVHTGYNRGMLQNFGWSLQRLRGIRGKAFGVFGHQSGVGGCYRHKSGFLVFSNSGLRYDGLLDLSYRQSNRRLTSRINSRRSDHENISSLERLVRRTVKSEEELEKKEKNIEKKEPKPLAVTPKQTQLESLAAGARGVLMTIRIFTAMMTWVVLFLIVSIWDGDSESFQDPGNKKGKRGPWR